MDAFKLPENQNVLISLSGGRTSGLMLWQILEANGGLPNTCKVLFANTGREMPETLDFVNDMESNWGVKITWLEYNRRDNKVCFDIVNHNSASREGQPFDKLIESRSYLPNVVSRFCTAELKVRTMKRYLVSIGWKHWVSAIGIRADEPSRINRKPTKDRWLLWYPLFEAGVTKRCVANFWEAQDFDLCLFGRNGVTPCGNCDGCFLKSEATRAMMWREYPERLGWWSDWEMRIGSQFIKTGSYSDLRDFVEKQGDWIFNNEAYLCQVDGGDCS